MVAVIVIRLKLVARLRLVLSKVVAQMVLSN